MDIRDIHTPVLLERCAELLAPALQREGAVFVDATLGMGGHSEAFLERFPTARLIGLDRDTDALRIAGERLARFTGRTTFVHIAGVSIGFNTGVLGIAVGVVGFLLMVGGVVFAVTPTRNSSRLSAARPSGSPRGTRTSSGSFMDRMNERWDRRHEER